MKINQIRMGYYKKFLLMFLVPLCAGVLHINAAHDCTQNTPKYGEKCGKKFTKEIDQGEQKSETITDRTCSSGKKRIIFRKYREDVYQKTMRTTTWTSTSGNCKCPDPETKCDGPDSFVEAGEGAGYWKEATSDCI